MTIRTDNAETLVRAGRELLRWDQERLAQEADVGIVAVRRFETGGKIRPELVAKIFLALQVAGLVFFGETEVGGAKVGGGLGLEPWVKPEPRLPKRIYKTGRGAAKPERKADGAAEQNEPSS